MIPPPSLGRESAADRRFNPRLRSMSYYIPALRRGLSPYRKLVQFLTRTPIMPLAFPSVVGAFSACRRPPFRTGSDDTRCAQNSPPVGCARPMPRSPGGLMEASGGINDYSEYGIGGEMRLWATRRAGRRPRTPGSPQERGSRPSGSPPALDPRRLLLPCVVANSLPIGTYEPIGRWSVSLWLRPDPRNHHHPAD